MQKKGFTLLELIVGLVIIGVGLISIMGLLQYSTRVTNTTKAQIIATNLAREGVEMVFNKRDTNRNLYSSKKDKCRLVNAVQTGIVDCETKNRFTPAGLGNAGYATYSGVTTLSGAYILTAQPSALNIKETNGTSIGSMNAYKLCFQNNKRDYCTNFSPTSTKDKTVYGIFWRMVAIKGLYDKDPLTNGGHLDASCTKGTDSTVSPVIFPTCGGSEAKELRFCSRVDYIFDSVRTVELCSAITNFIQ